MNNIESPLNEVLKKTNEAIITVDEQINDYQDKISSLKKEKATLILNKKRLEKSLNVQNE